MVVRFFAVYFWIKKISADIYKKNMSDLIRGFGVYLKPVLSDEKLQGSCLFSKDDCVDFGENK